jgi:DnaK suppressor protein
VAGRKSANVAQRLEQLRSDLLKELGDGLQSGAVVELDQARLGRLSRMDALQAQAMFREASHRIRKRIAGVDLALQRLQAGDYGYCEECGEEIDPRRLAIDLPATRCIRCAGLLES